MSSVTGGDSGAEVTRCPAVSLGGLTCSKGDCYSDHTSLNHRDSEQSREWGITSEDRKRWNEPLNPRKPPKPTEGDTDGSQHLDS